MNALRNAIARAALSAALLAAAPLAAQTVVIRNATVHPVVGDPMPDAHVRIVDGRIAAVGPDAPTDGADTIIEAQGLHVYPGLFASLAQVGLVEISGIGVVNDTDEGNSPSTAQVRAFDAYNPQSELIPVTRVNGVTHALVSPAGGNVLTGQGAVMALDGKFVDDAAIAPVASLHITLGEAPTGRFSTARRMPSTRMGLAAFLRAEFDKALAYQDGQRRHAERLEKHERDLDAFPAKLAEWEARDPDGRGDRPKEPEAPRPPSRDLAMEALVLALEGKIPAVFEAYRLDDIETALRLSDEYGLRTVLAGATSAWRIADRLAERGVPVVLAATHQPSRIQTHDAAYENAAILHAAGVRIAFLSADRTHNLRNLPYEAGLAAAHGLDRQAALEAVTINPARIWGLEDELGSIEPGKRANLLVSDGDPLQPLTRIHAVLVNGNPVPLESRQTRLAREWGGANLPEDLR